MITIAKLSRLKDRTCVRKTARLYHQMAQDAQRGQLDRAYLAQLSTLFASSQFRSILKPDQLKILSEKAATLSLKEGKDAAILCDDIHYYLLSQLGNDPADWDFLDEEGNLDGEKRNILPHFLVLDRLRSPYNIGSIFRSADSFGIQKIYLVEGCAEVEHPRTLRTSRGCTSTVDYEVIGEEALLVLLDTLGLPLFALETGGTEYDLFPFPQAGVAVIGGEELGVSPQLLMRCDASLGRLTIPLGGSKGSLNVAVATGIMLHGWYSA